MIADDVAVARQFLCNIRTLLHVASYQEERSSHIMFRENLQKAKSVGIVRTVVVSQRNLF